MSVANDGVPRLTVIVRSASGFVLPLIGTCRLITVPEAVPAGIGATALTMPSELEYDQSMSSGVSAGPVTVTGNVIEFAPGESPSGDEVGDALPIEIVQVGGSALTVPVATKSSVPASRAAKTKRPPSPSLPPI